MSTRDKIDKQMIATVAMLIESVAEIKSNHLPHFQARLDRIDERMWAGGVTIITILVGILVTLIWK